MKTVSVIALLSAAAGSAFAQLSPLPPSSTTDGVVSQPIGLNAGPTHWEDPSDLGAYRVAADGTVPRPSTGLAFQTGPNETALFLRNQINAGGGTIRTIFVGETAGWRNDFGYTYSGRPQGPNSYTVWTDIQAVTPGNTVSFGDHFDVSFDQGEAATWDIWLNGTDSFTTVNPPAPTANGGVYTAFNPANSSPFIPPGNVQWASMALMVNTWVPALGAYADVSTYLVSFEDWRLDRGSDRDYSDVLVALQFYDRTGRPFADVPVPEPSTYGLMGAAALLGLMAHRRWKAKKAAATA